MPLHGNAEFVHQYFAAIDARQFDRLQAMFGPDYLLHFDGMPAMNADAAASFFAGFIGAFTDMHHTVHDVLVDGDRAAARIVISGTHQGEFMGRPATGSAVLFPAINLFRFVDNQIAEHWINSDSVGLLQQIGAFPMPGQGRF
jgi:steroid delta-isomerase-like uncharacterized protein